MRNGLKKHFDWNGHKIEIVGIFEDGIPAFEYMKTHEVDIIITDVRMIHMDGITLAQKASVLYPEVKVLFISGYADVEYLKEALKIDAVDYILKSIDLNELDGVVTKTGKAIGQRTKRPEFNPGDGREAGKKYAVITCTVVRRTGKGA